MLGIFHSNNIPAFLMSPPPRPHVNHSPEASRRLVTATLVQPQWPAVPDRDLDGVNKPPLTLDSW